MNGIPQEVEREQTDPNIRAALQTATVTDVARALVDQAKPDQRQNKLLIALMAALLGPGGALAVVYVSDSRSKDNAEVIREIKPKVEANSQAVREIGDKIGTVATEQIEIGRSIKAMEDKNVRRLEKELEEARRELRRRRR